ncbi:nuclear transport factor 2 family protein [Chryseobacterium cheonjiense]|uniref:SnoaL-like domain-containing protein n=1 Tax=Chryseobacterium cheonjiense TaxID=2728845 RepID=A0A7Y0FHZ8_9FLAO|nr:nuclear transport factor 2 family protein [Chryseobacterium cheonjiense]NML56816.1 SnoaL-like domain-containing protein [Chryseobacterium cheonjiense]
MKNKTNTTISALKLIVFFVILNFSGNVTAQSYSEQELQTKQTVDKFFEYVGSKNPDKIASVISENVDWYIFESKYMPWTGHRSKRDQISELFKTLFTYFVEGSDKFEAQSFLLRGNQVAVFGMVERTVKKTEKHFKMPFAMRITVENNLITQFTMYEETLIIEKAFQ